MILGHEQLDVYPLNIAEGNGKATDGDRRRFFEIARGSALECGAGLDVVNLKSEVRLTISLGAAHMRGYTVGEQAADYGIVRIDTDTDSDPDADKS
jgi:hypothetical protein